MYESSNNESALGSSFAHGADTSAAGSRFFFLSFVFDSCGSHAKLSNFVLLSIFTASTCVLLSGLSFTLVLVGNVF